MKLSLALLASTLVLAEADGSRRLGYEKIAGYEPGSQVTDHCAIDLDQRSMESQLARNTPESFETARRIYEEGAHSKSYAQVTLASPLTADLSKGSKVTGWNAEGDEVAGKAYQDYGVGDYLIKVQYDTTNLQESYVECQVGALPADEANLKGCLADEGTLTIGGTDYAYNYIPLVDNNNGRTIAGFSTNARGKMRVGCKGCPYRDFQQFYDYYGVDDYAHQWVLAAFNGEATQFTNGNADFSGYSFGSREQIIKKSTAYMTIFMYVVREWEDALDDCRTDCINCNDDPVHAWDEGVCFYTGSIEGQDGLNPNGRLLHQLADKRCVNYKTCGETGTELGGTAKLNHDIFDLFSTGQYQLQASECAAARETTRRVIDLMYVPMIQGAMRYAHKVDRLGGDEKARSEGAAFAHAVLPRVHAADPDAASVVYSNLRVGAPGTDFRAVKAAFEGTYADLGITCADVGGLWNEATGQYYEGMEPCSEVAEEEEEAEAMSGAAAAGVGVLAVATMGAALL